MENIKNRFYSLEEQLFLLKFLINKNNEEVPVRIEMGKEVISIDLTGVREICNFIERTCASVSLTGSSSVQSQSKEHELMAQKKSLDVISVFLNEKYKKVFFFTEVLVRSSLPFSLLGKGVDHA